VPFLWRRIHVIHHWARHPLSRNTYQDHWLDNFGNAVVGEVAAQILLPIDGPFFVVSRLFRIMESLEKHAGVCGATNLAHSAQRWLPYAQMPHHHDWHHEGHKSCNFTFAALGGVWDCWFGTRKTGRAMRFPECATSRDVADDAAGKRRATNPLGNITSPAIVRSAQTAPLVCSRASSREDASSTLLCSVVFTRRSDCTTRRREITPSSPRIPTRTGPQPRASGGRARGGQAGCHPLLDRLRPRLSTPRPPPAFGPFPAPPPPPPPPPPSVATRVGLRVRSVSGRAPPGPQHPVGAYAGEREPQSLSAWGAWPCKAMGFVGRG